jgi:hypothetical protein
MKKSAKFLGKSLLALALGIIVVAGLAVAGLLSYYGKVVGTATVSQSVRLVDPTNGDELVCQDSQGSGCTVSNYQYLTIVAGDTGYTGPFELRNYASSDVSVNIQATVTNGPGGTDGITVTVTGVDENGECSDNVNAPTSVPGRSSNSYGVAKFCLKVSSQPNAIAGSYGITTTVSVPSQ